MGTLCFGEFFAQYLTCISVRSRCCGAGTATTRTGWSQRHNKAVGRVLETSQAGTWANPEIRECKGVGGVSLSTGSWTWRWWTELKVLQILSILSSPLEITKSLGLVCSGAESSRPGVTTDALKCLTVSQSCQLTLIHDNLSVRKVHPLNSVSQMWRTTAQADGISGMSSALRQGFKRVSEFGNRIWADWSELVWGMYGNW